MNRLNKSFLGLVAISAGESTNMSTNNIILNGNFGNQDKIKKADQALKILQNSAVVCFDVDSTVIKEEGIDELAKFCGKGSEVAQLTREAMKGSMTFQDALKLRLNKIRPSHKQIKDFLIAQPSTFSPKIKELVKYLKKNGTTIFLISGGFDCLIEPIARELGIPTENVFANKLMFYYNGEYAGFDSNQPTSRSGGKSEAISLIRKIHGDNVKITMIGDGATDLEAVPPADYFIGYGGNVIRNEVQARSQYYVTDFAQLLPLSS